jgi:membrane protease YdiL (CAAX protease family)
VDDREGAAASALDFGVPGGILSFPMQRPLFVDLTTSLALFYLLAVAQGAFLYLPIPPLAATGQVLLVGLLFYARYGTRGDAAQQERRDRSLFRPLGAQWPWAIVSALAVTVVLVALLSVYARLVPVPTETDTTVAEYLKSPLGWLPFLVLSAVVSPLVEEVVFRGWIQGRLSAELGPEAAIINTAALFVIALATLSLSVWSVPYLFLLGLSSGYTVYLTRSVWSGVLMNAAFNGALYAVDQIYPDTDNFTALSSRTNGAFATAGLIVIFSAIAVFAWHRERIIHDRTEAEAKPAQAAPPD